MDVTTKSGTDARTPPIRFIAETDDRHVDDVYSIFSAPEDESRKVEIVRPFAALSKSTYSGAIVPPLSVAYLASVLRNAGYPVGIIDAQGEDIFNIRLSECGKYNLHGLETKKLLELIAADTFVLGVSMMFSQEWPPQREFIVEARRKFPDVKIVVGGEHVTALPEYVLRDCPEIDFAVIGEGELTFLELVHGLCHDTDVRRVPGLAFIDEGGNFVSNDLSKRINHVDELPRPAWDLCKVENYFQPNWTFGIGMGRHMPILATRGCPYQCTFCSNPTMWTTRYMMRNPKEVVDEIEHLVTEYGADSIDFCDLTAIVKKDWTLAFCDELKRRSLNITWQLPSGTRSEALDKETLEAIFETGCRLVTYAPESGSERTLAAIKKKLRLSSIVESMRLAKAAGHVVKVNLIIGFPDETWRDVVQTIWFAFKMALRGMDDCSLATFSPYPGSELYRELRDRNEIPAPDDTYFENLLVFFDFTRSASYCRKVSGRALVSFRLLGYMLFYSTAYVCYPKRIFRVARSLLRATFRPSNVFEQRVFDVYSRVKRRGAN